jgi:hypothetical protein
MRRCCVLDALDCRRHRGNKGLARVHGFIERLRQRKLVQWAVAYAAGAFALLQGIDIVGAKFGWPESIERALFIALSIGLFVTLVLAWRLRTGLEGES